MKCLNQLKNVTVLHKNCMASVKLNTLKTTLSLNSLPNSYLIITKNSSCTKYKVHYRCLLNLEIFHHQIWIEFPLKLSQLYVQFDITFPPSSQKGLWAESSCEVLQWKKVKKLLTHFLDVFMSYVVECTGLCDPDFPRLKREGLSMTVLGRKCGDQYLFHGVKRQKLLCGIARHPATHCNCRLQTEGQLASLLGAQLHYNRRLVLIETSKNSL